jgi:hypothetical protein
MEAHAYHGTSRIFVGEVGMDVPMHFVVIVNPEQDESLVDKASEAVAKHILRQNVAYLANHLDKLL